MGFEDENKSLLLEDFYIVEVLLSFRIALPSDLEWSLQEEKVCVWEEILQGLGTSENYNPHKAAPKICISSE